MAEINKINLGKTIFTFTNLSKTASLIKNPAVGGMPARASINKNNIRREVEFADLSKGMFLIVWEFNWDIIVIIGVINKI